MTNMCSNCDHVSVCKVYSRFRGTLNRYKKFFKPYGEHSPSERIYIVLAAHCPYYKKKGKAR